MPDPAPILLLTRPEAAARRFAAAAVARFGDRVQPLIAPLMQIVEETGPLPMEDIRGLVFTSENGVRAAAARTARRDLPAWCVGDRTTAAALAAGFPARSAQGDAVALARLLVAQQVRGPLLHLHGEHVQADFGALLAAAGIAVRNLAAYRQEPQPLSESALTALLGPARVFVPLFSPRSAQLFRVAAGNARAALDLVAISAAAAEPLRDWPGATLAVAARPDADAMLNALADRLAAGSFA
jgi:uroporphyrinogen-III synthase